MAKKTQKKYSFRSEYEENENIKPYGQSGLSLFALSYHLDIEDIDGFAADSITEGGDDKKIDICFIDVEAKKLVVAQNYVSEKWTRSAAPTNKADDLNASINWLFSASINNVPPRLKDKAIEIREAIKNDEISDIEIFYIHNCPESVNCERALNTVADSLRSHLSSISSNSETINITYREIGLNTIEELYKSRNTQIKIDEWIRVPIGGDYLEETTKDWTAIQTTVPAIWVKKLHDKYKNDLFSANYREYLGIIPKEDNINNQITSTAIAEPQNFWVYNNGITALTFELNIKTRWKKIRGISIINGAQTTGSLGSIPDSAAETAKVPIRFVECKDSSLIDKIILFNNTQNAIKPEDIRSKDSRQTRIHEEFNKFGINYHYRRSEQKISKKTITAKSIAAPLCAFHGDSNTSYRNPKKIFKDDETYEKVFRNDISIGHIFLIRALSKAIDKLKNELKKKVTLEESTEKETKLFKVLKYSASKHFIIFLVGYIAEEIMGTRITDSYKWSCKDESISSDNTSLINGWILVLKTILPYISDMLEKKGEEAYYEVPRSFKQTKEIAKDFQTQINSLEPTVRGQFENLRKRTALQ